MDISDQTMFLSFFGIATYRFFRNFLLFFCYIYIIYINCDFCFFGALHLFAAELDNVENRALPCVFLSFEHCSVISRFCWKPAFGARKTDRNMTHTHDTPK